MFQLHSVLQSQCSKRSKVTGGMQLFAYWARLLGDRIGPMSYCACVGFPRAHVSLSVGVTSRRRKWPLSTLLVGCFQHTHFGLFRLKWARHTDTDEERGICFHDVSENAVRSSTIECWTLCEANHEQGELLNMLYRDYTTFHLYEGV